MNVDELLTRADLVVLSEVISVDQDMETTRAQVQIFSVLKGLERPGNLVTIESPGGRVFIDENQPSWSVRETDLLFLQKSPSGNTYTCVNQADGQKIVRGRHIYPFHDNITYGVPLKDYIKDLEETVKNEGLSDQAKKPSA